MRPERRIKPGVDGGLRAASWVVACHAIQKRRSGPGVDWRSFALWANGNMGPSKSRIVNHGFGSL